MNDHAVDGLLSSGTVPWEKIVTDYRAAIKLRNDRRVPVASLASAMQFMETSLGMSQEEIARRFGRSRTWVSQLRAFSRLPAEARVFFDSETPETERLHVSDIRFVLNAPKTNRALYAHNLSLARRKGRTCSVSTTASQ